MGSRLANELREALIPVEIFLDRGRRATLVAAIDTRGFLLTDEKGDSSAAG